MIKKMLFYLLSVVLCFLLFGCSSTAKRGYSAISQATPKNNISNNKTVTKSNTAQNNQFENKEETKSNVLVVYFSCTGTTEQLAQYAAEILQADTYQIVPEQPYTEKDLAYYTNSRADKEQNDINYRPTISGSIENIEQYDTILLGYPIWHGQAPRIISTFLESYDFSNKTILPFCTSHSSGIGSSADNLHSLCSDTTKWLEAKRFDSNTSKEIIQQWLNDIKL